MNLKRLFVKHRWSFLLMLFLVLVDAGLSVLYPLFIGFAIDDVIIREYTGAVLLGGLGLLTLVIGSGRRFYDSRFYAKLYRHQGLEVGKSKDQPTSAKTAHLGFLREVVEFFENSMPEIVNSTIGLIGTLLIIATIDLNIFLGCLLILFIVVMIYGFSQGSIVRYNGAYNDEQERQVTALSEDSPILLHHHLWKLMQWNIKLSDLETLNFSLTWLVMMAFLVYSIISAVGQGDVTHGAIFSLVLYIFQFMESVSIMPLFYQHWLRLTEIIKRLNSTEFA
ncbi:MAG: ABC transporter six-transmembrane domain-containing protein [Bacteroidota bacterium]